MVEPEGLAVERRETRVGSEAEAERIVMLLGPLTQLTDPRLAPVRRVAHHGDTVSLVFEPGPGRRLDEMMDEDPPTPGQAVAITMEVLSGLAVLQRAGVGHGALDERSVHLTPDGRVRLLGYAARPRLRRDADAIGWLDPRNDLGAAGRLLCEMLMVSPFPDPRQPLREAERIAPALVAGARALAAGRDRSARTAIVALASAAGGLAEPSHVKGELAGLAGRVELSTRAVVPTPTASWAAPPPAPAAPSGAWGAQPDRAWPQPPPPQAPPPRAPAGRDSTVLAWVGALALLAGIGLVVLALGQAAAAGALPGH